jgi:hypothetical protein
MADKQKNTGMARKSSKIFVLGFLGFVALIYIGGYFYDKSKNEVKVHYPRLVMVVQEIRDARDYKTADELLATPDLIAEAFEKGMIEIITHEEYASGITDINNKHFMKHRFEKPHSGSVLSKKTADCIKLGERINAAKAPSQKKMIKNSWAHKLCRMPFEIYEK